MRSKKVRMSPGLQLLLLVQQYGCIAGWWFGTLPEGIWCLAGKIICKWAIFHNCIAMLNNQRGGDWNMNFIFPFSWECHHPNCYSLIFFRGVGIPPTRLLNSYYPLVMTNIAIETGQLYLFFPLKMVIFRSFLYVYQRVLYVSFQRCNSHPSFQGEVVLAEPKGAKGEAEQVRSVSCAAMGDEALMT